MLRKNNRGIWFIDLTINNERVRKSTRTSDKKLADQVHALLEVDMIKGAHGLTKKTYSLEATFREAMLEHWKHTKDARKVSQKWDQIAEHLDTSKDVSSVDAAAIKALSNSFAAIGNSNSTINRKMAVLRTLLNYAAGEGYLDHVPNIKVRSEPPPRHRVLTEKEEASMMRFFDKNYSEQAGLFEFLLSSGNRLSEALKLTWLDVDLKSGKVIFYDTKSKETLHKPMTTLMRNVLESRQGLISPFPYTVHMVESYWKKLRTHLGYEKDAEFVVHSLRHTCASRLAAQGVDLLRIQKWLGHKSFITTQRYAQLSDTHLGDVVNSINEFDRSLTENSLIDRRLSENSQNKAKKGSKTIDRRLSWEGQKGSKTAEVAPVDIPSRFNTSVVNSSTYTFARVVKLVDTRDLKSIKMPLQTITYIKD